MGTALRPAHIPYSYMDLLGLSSEDIVMTQARVTLGSSRLMVTAVLSSKSLKVALGAFASSLCAAAGWSMTLLRSAVWHNVGHSTPWVELSIVSSRDFLCHLFGCHQNTPGIGRDLQEPEEQQSGKQHDRKKGYGTLCVLWVLSCCPVSLKVVQQLSQEPQRFWSAAVWRRRVGGPHMYMCPWSKMSWSSWCWMRNEGMDPCSSPYMISITIPKAHSLIAY